MTDWANASCFNWIRLVLWRATCKYSPWLRVGWVQKRNSFCCHLTANWSSTWSKTSIWRRRTSGVTRKPTNFWGSSWIREDGTTTSQSTLESSKMCSLWRHFLWEATSRKLSRSDFPGIKLPLVLSISEIVMWSKFLSKCWQKVWLTCLITKSDLKGQNGSKMRRLNSSKWQIHSKNHLPLDSSIDQISDKCYI